MFLIEIIKIEKKNIEEITGNAWLEGKEANISGTLNKFLGIEDKTGCSYWFIKLIWKIRCIY